MPHVSRLGSPSRLFSFLEDTNLIWLIPAAFAALSFFKLGSFFVVVRVMSLLIRGLVVCCLLLLAVVGVLLWQRRRRS